VHSRRRLRESDLTGPRTTRPRRHPHHPHHKELDYEDDAVATALSTEPQLETTGSLDECCEVDGYGELTRASVDALAAAVGLSAETPTAKFYDLGSGVGKIVLHAVLAGYADHAVGVELNDGRHRIAQATLEEIAASQDGRRLEDAVEFVNSDMLDVDLSDAQVIYLNQACFPEHVRAGVARKILDAPNVRVVAAAPSIPQLEASGLFVADPGFLVLDMEIYTYGTPLKIYRRVSSPATANDRARTA